MTSIFTLPKFPDKIDTNLELYHVFNTSESPLRLNFSIDDDTIYITPREWSSPEMWDKNSGILNIEGELVHYSKTITEDDIISYTPFQRSDDSLYNAIIVTGNGVSVEVTDATSISTYGRYRYKVNDSRIDDEDDAETLANKILSEYKDPIWYGSVVIDGDTSVEIGKKFTLNLTKLNIVGTHKLKSYSHIINKDGFTTKLDFGREKYDPNRDIALIKNQLLETHYGVFAGLAAATNASSTADGKIVTFFQDSEPDEESSSLGDLWFDTNDDNKLYRYNGSSWVTARDDGISASIAAAANAQSTADSKIIVFYSATSSPPSNPSQGDLWVQTNNNNYVKVYNSGDWRDVGDYYTYWSNQVDDDGTMPDPNADSTASNSQYHSWLLNSPKNAHHPSYLVNGQSVTDTTGSSEGSWAYLTDFSLYCDCLLITGHEYSIDDMIQGIITVRDHNNSVLYSDVFQNCSMDGSYLYGIYQTTTFLPSGGSWKWDYTEISANDSIQLNKEHIITLETDV